MKLYFGETHLEGVFCVQVNEEEDRRRLKEKLKEAFESSRRSYHHSEESEGQVHLEIVIHSVLPRLRPIT
jgi:hypothetical protein